MGGKSSKAPKTPDYSSLANNQAALDKAAADAQTTANRANQTNPMGSSQWTQDPATGQWTQNVTWDPAITANVKQGQALQSQKVSDLSKQGDFSYADAPQYSEYGKDVPQYDPASGQYVGDALYKSLTSRQIPLQQQQEEAFTTQLRQQGLTPGTEAFDRAMQNMLTSHGDVLSKAALDATLAGGKESRDIYGALLAGQGQGYQQHMDDYKANLAGHSMGFDQSMKEYQLPWEQAMMANSLANPSYVPSFDTYNAATGYKAADQLGAAQQTYEQQMANYNDKQKSKSGLGSSIGGIAGFAMGGPMGASLGAGLGGSIMSDARLKTDIQPLLPEESFKRLIGLHPVSWSWIDGGAKDAGVLAQEIGRNFPHLVEMSEAGNLHVKYTELVALLLGALKFIANKESQNGAASSGS